MVHVFRLVLAPGDVNDGRACAVEVVPTEERDDVLVEPIRRQCLPSAIVDRQNQVMRRDVDAFGPRRELVLDDGRGNQLSHLAALLGLDLNGHRGVGGRRGFRARHSTKQGCEKGAEVEVACRARRAEACLLEPKLQRSACFDPPLTSADGRVNAASPS